MRQWKCLVSVDIRLEGTQLPSQGIRLGRGKFGQLSIDVVKMQKGDLFIKDLGKDIDANIFLAGLSELDVLLAERLVLSLVQSDLCEDLIGERAGHDEGRVASCTAEIDQTTLGEEDDVAAAGHEVSVNLGFDVLYALGVLLQPSNVDLDIEMANVANDGVVTHGLEVFTDEDVSAASRSNEDLAKSGSFLHSDNLVARNGSLQGIDGVNLGNKDVGTKAVESLGTSLANITITGDDGDLAGDHNISSTFDTIDEGFSASIKIVKFGLCDTVVDIDSRDQELVALEHSVEMVNTSGGLLGDTIAALEHLWVFVVDESGEIPTIVKNEVEGFS